MKFGSTIGIFAPSSSIIPEKFEAGLQILKDQGYKTVIHPQTYIGAGEQTQIAGTPEQKIAAYKELVSEKSVDFIMTATGGNRSCFLLDGLATLETHKPIMGFSDITALLGLHYKLGIPSIFGPTVQTLGRMEEHHIDLTFKKLNSQAPMNISLAGSISISKGEVTAPIFAATMSNLASLCGTKFLPDLNNHILVLEDIGDETNRLDRMIWQILNQINPAGVIFGQFLAPEETGRPYGEAITEILQKHGSLLAAPCIMNAPIAHDGRIFPITCGQSATLDATNRVLIL